MLCLNYLTRGPCPLGSPLLPERPISTIRNGLGKFCSIQGAQGKMGKNQPSNLNSCKTQSFWSFLLKIWCVIAPFTLHLVASDEPRWNKITDERGSSTFIRCQHCDKVSQQHRSDETFSFLSFKWEEPTFLAKRSESTNDFKMRFLGFFFF